MAQAEIDTSTRPPTGQRSPLTTGASRCNVTAVEGLAHLPHLRLAATSRAQVEFSREGPNASSDQLRAVRLAGRTLHLRKVLHHLQGAAQRPPLLRRSLLLSGLPRSLRRLSGRPWHLNHKPSVCSSTPTRVWPRLPEAWSAISPMSRASTTMLSLVCNPRSLLPARKLSNNSPPIIPGSKSPSRACPTAWKCHWPLAVTAFQCLASIRRYLFREAAAQDPLGVFSPASIAPSTERKTGRPSLASQNISAKPPPKDKPRSKRKRAGQHCRRPFSTA
jgi:hypothetical protein